MICDPSATIATTPAYRDLTEQEFLLAKIGILLQWVAASDPGLDLSPNAVLARAVVFSGYTEQQMQLAEVQLLCEKYGP